MISHTFGKVYRRWRPITYNGEKILSQNRTKIFLHNLPTNLKKNILKAFSSTTSKLFFKHMEIQAQVHFNPRQNR